MQKGGNGYYYRCKKYFFLIIFLFIGAKGCVHTTVPTIRVYLMPPKEAKQAAAKNACEALDVEGKWKNLYHHWDYH